MLEKIKVCAVMTLPRIGYNDFWSGAYNSLQGLGIPLRTRTGVFWEQCLQDLFEEVIADGFDWIMVLDYDSLFTKKHALKMLRTMEERSDIDALAPLQPRRTAGTPLLTIKGVESFEVGGDPIEVTTAHFGLTLLKLNKVKDIPKPWFVGTPNNEGRWQEGKIDPDPYFWLKWKEYGNSIWVHCGVRIGHMEVMVRDYDELMRERLMVVEHWKMENKDPGVLIDKTGAINA